MFVRKHIIIHTRISATLPREEYVCADKISCKLCGYVDRDRSMLLDHIEKHFVDNTMETCPFCDAWMSRPTLGSHIKAVHPEAE